MIFKETNISGCYEITLSPIGDDRGWFARTFCKEEFSKINLNTEWVQFNHSFSQQKGTVRGLHFQNKPFQEVKLIRCISGEVVDIVVDIRKDSPTFLQHIKMELSENNNKMIYIPTGCAHGFQTIKENTALLYHHSVAYKKTAEDGLNITDPILNLKLPLPINNISERDKSHPYLKNNFEGI